MGFNGTHHPLFILRPFISQKRNQSSKLMLRVHLDGVKKTRFLYHSQVYKLSIPSTAFKVINMTWENQRLYLIRYNIKYLLTHKFF